MKLEGVKVVVVGMARSGVAAVELLREKGASVRAVAPMARMLRPPLSRKPIKSTPSSALAKLQSTSSPSST